MAITQIALRRLQLDAVWWLVTPGNPLKSEFQPPSLAERMNLCRQFARDNRVHVTGFEGGLASSFTAATLAYLKARRPGTRFVWLMGADNMAGFHHWHMWRDIIETCPVAVIDRPGWHLRALASPAAAANAAFRLPETQAGLLPFRPPPAWVFLTGPLSPRSSTMMRNSHMG